MINLFSSVLCSRYMFLTLRTKCINSSLLHIRNQVFLTSIFDWRRTVNFLRHPQRLINPQLTFLIMCSTILSCITGHISHSVISLLAYMEPFIISIRLCNFCLVVASCNFYLKNKNTKYHPLPPNFSRNRLMRTN